MAYLFDKHTVEKPRYAIVPRPYQHDALDGCFRVWESGIRGALIRIATGLGKTAVTAMAADRWLQRGDNWKVMVVSYEKQLVWQFAQEIQDILGIKPGIEMESEELDPYAIPNIVVASRQTLMTHTLISQEQREFFHQHGYEDDVLRLCTFRLGKRLVKAIKQGVERDVIETALDDWNNNYRCDHQGKAVSRLHKFDWQDNWLVAMDESHKFAYKLNTVTNIVDWFERNPEHRRLGMSVGGDTFIVATHNGQPWTGTIKSFWDAFCKDQSEVANLEDADIEVRSYDGERFGWKKLRAAIRHTIGTKQLYRIRTRRGVVVDVTGDHSLFVLKHNCPVIRQTADIRVGDKLLLEDDIDCRGTSVIDTLDWIGSDNHYHVASSDLVSVIESCIRCPKKRYSKKRGVHGPSLSVHEYRKYCNGSEHIDKIYWEGGSGNWLPPRIDTSKLSYVLGFYVGNGSSDGSRLILTCNDAQLPVLLKELSVLEADESIVGPVTVSRQANGPQCTDIRVSHSGLTRVITNLCGNGALHKRVPDIVLSFDNEHLLRFLAGMMDTDGHLELGTRNRKRYNYTTISPQLVHGLCTILKRFNCLASVYPRKQRLGGTVKGRQIIGNHQAYTIGFSAYDLCGKTTTSQGTRRTRAMGTGEAVTVVSIEKLKVTDDTFVYDLSVDDSHWQTFVANGILAHNTATPKRSDGVSIGAKMFPGIAIDYPLCTASGPCAVRDGYAVPYVQKYIRVESVDFAEIKELAGTNQKKWDAEVAKRLETELASFCEPMLDLVDDRSTLIFSPSVNMAKQVAEYINARAKCRCVCGKAQWHPTSRVGDGAKCKQCSEFITHDHVLDTPENQANAVWGEINPQDRKLIYEAHQRGEFQMLSACSLLHEGYNDPNCSCIAIFRPVSKKASSSAEQMKGRGCRVERGCIEGLETAEERIKAIAASGKPNCIAEGTLILTDYGLVPIEHIAVQMKVWDGIEFVSHDGVICQGEQEVISYAGLTATKDHKVFTKRGLKDFASCATEQTSIVLSGDGEEVVRECDGRYRGGSAFARASESRFPVSRMQVWKTLLEAIQQSSLRYCVQVLRQVWTVTNMARQTMRICKTAMSKPEGSRILSLRCEGNPIPIRVGSRHGIMGADKSWPETTSNNRQDRQQSALRAWESTICNGVGTEPKYSSSNTLSRYTSTEKRIPGCDLQKQDSVAPSSARIDDQTDIRTFSSKQTQVVYDIINAGPRHRFTANGLLVCNCLIIDLVGCTGLGDCATTVQIYAEGEDDEVVARAETLVQGGVEDVQEAIQRAKEEVASEREQRRLERERREEAAREAARQRAKANAQVQYSVHDVGHDGQSTLNAASDKQLKFIRHLGMELTGYEPSKGQAGRIIDMLLNGNTREYVADHNHIRPEWWEPVALSNKQRWALQQQGVYPDKDMTPYVASRLIDRMKTGGVEPSVDVIRRISQATSQRELDKISGELKAVWTKYSESDRATIRQRGKERRDMLNMDF